MLGQLLLRSYHRATYLESLFLIFSDTTFICFIFTFIFMFRFRNPVQEQYHKQ
jgi:hypothetical protein